MFANILGWFWICMGVFLFLKPEVFRNKIKKKGIKKLKRFFFGLTLTLSILLISVAWKAHGAMAKAVVIFGIFGLIKAILIVSSKSFEKMTEWIINKPLIIFRVGALIHIGIGITILTFK